MQEFINLYSEHKSEIEKFLIETIRSNRQLMQQNDKEIQKFYGIFTALELIYITDQNYIQTSPNLYKHKSLNNAIGRNREYLIPKVANKEEGIFVSEPYISSATGDSCVTVMFRYGMNYYFFDFNVSTLLTRFGLLELHPVFNMVTKSFYFSAGFALMLFSLISIISSFYDYVLQLLHSNHFGLENVFKPIVALTMGLAIFDLAKTILEREVFFKAYSDKKDESRILIKFLIAIIIALSIEALMVVFKIALEDPRLMINAFYLITGVALIIFSLAFYTRWVKVKGEKNIH